MGDWNETNDIEFGRLWIEFGRLWIEFGRLWINFGMSLEDFGSTLEWVWKTLDQLWNEFGRLWINFGMSLEDFGSTLEWVWKTLDQLWNEFGRLWINFGMSLEDFGSTLEWVWKTLDQLCINSGRCLKSSCPICWILPETDLSISQLILNDDDDDDISLARLRYCHLGLACHLELVTWNTNTRNQTKPVQFVIFRSYQKPIHWLEILQNERNKKMVSDKTLFLSLNDMMMMMMMMMLTNYYWLTLEDFWIEEGVEAEAEGAGRSMHWYHHAAEKAAEKRRSS